MSSLNTILKGREGRIVASNFGYLTLVQVAGYLFPLITMPYLARVIGTVGFGRIAFASAVLVWIQTIADWGFTYTATRDVAQNREDKQKVSMIFSNVLWSRIFLSSISGIILLLLILTVPLFKENALILVISFMLIPGHILFPDWFFQAIEKMKYTALMNLIAKTFFTILVFVFIHQESDYYLQPLLTTLGYLLSGCISMYLILKKWGYQLKKPNIKSVLITIKGGTDVFLNNLMPNLYNSFSVLLLGFWGGSYANGIFDGGNKFSSLVYRFMQVLSRAFFPFLSRHPDKHFFYSVVNMVFGFVSAAILFLFAPLIVKVMLAPGFENSVPVLRILSISLIFLALNNTYGTNFLIIYHHERSLRNITLIASIIGMVVAIPLVKKFTYIGAAYTILISRALLGTLACIRANIIIRKSKKKTE